MALMPKRVKHRKSQRRRIKGNATRGNRVVFGDFGLQALQGGWIKAQTIDNPDTFNQEQVQAAANVIAAIANSGMGALYGPGTDEGSGWKETRLKSEFFDEPDKVREIAVRFINEANQLREVAGNGDRRAIARQFARVGDACSACHDSYREPQ